MFLPVSPIERAGCWDFSFSPPVIAGEKEDGITQPEPLILENHSPRISSPVSGVGVGVKIVFSYSIATFMT
ncbi:MAG: hypothetical protein H7Y36_08885 [Armatimonadetes bacterium]|nr:hypothetical protein [Akkermansiaceae bacterium]